MYSHQLLSRNVRAPLFCESRCCVESPLLPLEAEALARPLDDGVDVEPLVAADCFLLPIKLPMLLLVRTRLLTPVTEDLAVGEADDKAEDEEAGVFELKKLRPLRTRVVLPEAPDLIDELLCGLELACVRVLTDERLVLGRL